MSFNNNNNNNMVEGDVRGGTVYVQKAHASNPHPPPSAPPSFSNSPVTTTPDIKRGRPSVPELLITSTSSPNTVLPKETPYLVRSASATISGYYSSASYDRSSSASANSSGPNSAGTSPMQSPTMVSPLQFSMSPPMYSSGSPLQHSLSASNLKLSDPAFLRKELQDKATWTADAMKEHPEVLEIMERVRPLNRAASFGRLFPNAVAKAKVPDDTLGGRETLLQLIMQHLQYEGLRASRKILEEESNMKYVDYQLNESRLLTLMRLAIRDTERVWELAMTLATLPQQQDRGISSAAEETQKMLEEHLSEIGLLQEAVTPDVYIWDEPEDKNVMFADEKDTSVPISPPSSPTASPPNLSGEFSPRDGAPPLEKVRTIKAASLNHLVTALTPVNYFDPDYVNTFLLTYQSFTTPTKLMQKLIERYHVPMKAGMTEEEWKKKMLPIHIRVGKVLRQWMKEHWSDFTPALIETVKAFIDNSLRLDGNQQLVKTLTQTLNSQLRPEESEKTRVFSEPPPEPKVPKNIFSPYLAVLDVDDEEIARQITLIDYEVFSSIKPSELLNQCWNKPKLRHRSPNVLRAISRFNEVSKWVTCSILRVERVKERARIMAKFIRIAEYAFKQFNNYDVTMSILAGLNQSAVHRLKHTKEEMPKTVLQTYNDLQSALSSNASYKEYRALLARTVPPCIPYLGVFLTDLTFIEEGNPDYINGLINFSKRRLVYNVISRVTQLQLAPYNLQPVYQIACLLWHPAREFAALTDDDFYKLSLEREPRGKDRSEIL